MAEMRRFCFDDETGETITYLISEETGEQLKENDNFPQIIVKKPCLVKEKNVKKICFPKGYNTKTEEFKSLKENILAGSNLISYRMLLIPPTILVFPSFFFALLMILEIYLHMRCHKQNKMLKNPQLYYRSPFHVVTSAFCACCQESQVASKISEMQDKRRIRRDYLRGIVI